MPGPFTTPVAFSVPLENRDARDNDFKALNVQEGLEEIDFRRERKEPTGFLNQTDMTMSFDDGTRTFTIAPVATDYTYYIRGCPFVKNSAENITIPDTDGIWYIYYDNVGTGNLVATQTLKSYEDPFIIVYTIYWNVSQSAAQWQGISLGSLSALWGVQRRNRNVTGAECEEGPTTFMFQNFTTSGDGTLDAHAQLGITGGKLYSEDVEFNLVHSATPSNDFEQDIELIGKIPIFYREGADPGVWRKIPATDFPLAEDLGNLIFWNENNGGTWQLTNASNKNFVSTYIFATTDPTEPIIGVLGDKDETSPLASLSQPLLTPTGLPYPQFCFIAAAIFQTANAFTNQPKARLISVSNALFADSIDRYAILAFYNGNANTGRVLEVTPNQDSEDQPLLIPEDSFIRTITVQSTANIDAGKKIGFFESADLVTPIFEVTIPFGGAQDHQFDVSEFFSKGDKVSLRITDGSINKPAVRFWVETVP